MEKVVFITGSSSGMGKAAAIELIKNNYIVYCGARNVDRMQDLKELGCHILRLDVTDHESNDLAVKQIIKEQGRIDVLFNNAGYGCFGSVEDIPLQAGIDQFDVNLFGLIDMTKVVIPYMRDQKSGLIINTSSLGGKMYLPMGAWYHASKYAVEGLSDCLRIELKQFNINVVILEPGIIKTNWEEIAINSAKKYSNNELYEKQVYAFEHMYDMRFLRIKDPEYIGKIVHKIIKHKRPKTRYLVGTMAKPMVLLRRITSDRLFDYILKVFLKY